jgi:hypothetical protein
VAALFGVLTLIAVIWSIVVYHRVYNSVRELLPPQFQDDLNSRYAFPVWALSHPTPLSVQAEYVRLVKGTCVAVFCGALTLLSSYQIVFGCLALVAFAVSVFSAIKASKTYEQNCNRAPAQGDEQNQ